MKKLLTALTIGALFISSCKKDFTFTEAGENTKLLLANNEPQLTPRSNDPRILFVDKNVLWSISNITALNPTITQQGVITGIDLWNGNMESNVFNSDVCDQEPIYNPFTDQLLSGPFNEYLYKCFIPTRVTTNTIIPGIANNMATGAAIPLGVNPADKKLYYYGQNNTNPIKKFVGSINVDGTNNVIIRQFNNIQVSPNSDDMNSCAIDFENGLIYMPSEKGLYVTSLNKSDDSKLYVPAKVGEKMSFGEVKVDNIHHNLFFSTVDMVNKIRKIYRVSNSGNLNTMIQVVKLRYLEQDPNQFNLSHDSFTFDISPETNTVFLCQRRQYPNTEFSSMVIRVNMDGTGFKLLHTGIYINTIIAATPKLVNN